MLKSVRVVSANSNPKNETLALGYSDTLPLYIRDISGLNPPKATINTTESIFKDGSYYNSSKNSDRNIVIELGYRKVPGFTNLESIRNKIYELFPIGRDIRLEFITDYLPNPVFIDGYVETNEVSVFTKEPIHIISIICPNPNFYENSYTVVNTTNDGINLTPYIGTAPSSFIFQKTFEKETGQFAVGVGGLNAIKLKYLPAGSVLRIDTEPTKRKIVFVKDNVESPAYTHVNGGTMSLTISASNAYFGVWSGHNSTSGFEIKFKKAYVGL